MNLKIGIVGLPNIGKSTLFEAITKQKTDIQNYPFTTIEPNQGVVKVPDPELDFLATHFKPKKTINAIVKFIDIAGLIKGANEGEGLGNAFLANIRETHLICMVVRCFHDKNIQHVEGRIDPIEDIEIINLELILSDLKTVENWLHKNQKKLQLGKVPDSHHTLQTAILAQEVLTDNKLIQEYNWNHQQWDFLVTLNLLTAKKMIIVGNVAEDNLINFRDNENVKLIEKYAAVHGWEACFLSAPFELTISTLNPDDQTMFLNEYNMTESGLSKLIKSCYHLLDLKRFLTAGKDEVRAWTFKNGQNARECAGIIHTDFYDKFIKAEVYSITDFMKTPSEKVLKTKGKIKLEGRDYLVKNGDVIYFKVGK